MAFFTKNGHEYQHKCLINQSKTDIFLVESTTDCVFYQSVTNVVPVQPFDTARTPSQGLTMLSYPLLSFVHHQTLMPQNLHLQRLLLLHPDHPILTLFKLGPNLVFTYQKLILNFFQIIPARGLDPFFYDPSIKRFILFIKKRR